MKGEQGRVDSELPLKRRRRGELARELGALFTRLRMHVIVGGGFPESRCAGDLDVVIEYLPAFDIYHHRLVLKSGTSYRLVT